MDNEEHIHPFISRWCQAITRKLHDISPEIQSKYAVGSEKYVHYQRVANKLYRETSARDIAEAGFLHGIPLKFIEKIDTKNIYQIKKILIGWTTLVNLDPTSETANRNRIRRVFLEIPTFKSIVLYIISQLDHIDPHRILFNWTKAFCRSAAILQYNVLPPLTNDNNLLTASFLSHIQNVFCEVAQLFGFWIERNTAENAVLYYQNRCLFDKIVELAIENQGPGGACEQRVNTIKRALQEMSPQDASLWGIRHPNEFDYQPRWEWRHLASMANKLGDSTGDKNSLGNNIDRCGYVTLTCPDVRSCYSLLGFLHSHYRYRFDALRDYIGRKYQGGFRSKYKALHLRVVTSDSSISVRLIPQKSEMQRLAGMKFNNFIKIISKLDKRGLWNITAFTPSGKAVVLPPGSTVLNFAHKIHSQLVGLTKEAIINRKERVGVLHKLEDNDEVELVKSDKLMPLPTIWSDVVPDNSVKSIRKDYKKTQKKLMGPYLQERGKAWLVARLNERGYQLNPGEAIINEILLESAERYYPTKKIDDNLSIDEWWLKQLGLLEEYIFSCEDKRPELKIEEHAALRLVRKIAGLIEKKYQIVHEVDFCVGDPPQCYIPIKCEKCNPDTESSIVWTNNSKGAKLHRAGAPCAGGGLDAKWLKRIYKPRSFLIRTSNRIGIAADILHVFKDYGVDINDQAGRKVGAKWGLFRIETEQITQKQSFDIKNRLLKGVGGVIEVLGPDDKKDPIMESWIASKPKSNYNIWSEPGPYYIGAKITDPCYFYGRDTELNDLKNALRAVNGKYSQGVCAFVQGPFKTGKSSLVIHFLGQYEEQATHPFIYAYTESGPYSTWEDICTSLKEQIISNLDKSHSNMKDWNSSNFKNKSLEETLTSIRNEWPDLVIVLSIDEVTRLFNNVAKIPLGINQVGHLVNVIQGLGKILLIWIGPLAPIFRMNPEFAVLLRAALAVEMREFSDIDAAHLLRSNNMANIHDINLNRGVANKANTFCGGNPYWLNRLGHIMWQQARGIGCSQVVYNHNTIERAMEIMLLDDDFFVDRIRFWGNGVFDDTLKGKNDQIMWKILCILSEVENRMSTQCKGLVVEQIQKKLIDKSPDYSTLLKREIDVLLRELKAWGSVRSDISDNKNVVWRVYCPAISNYINTQMQTEG